MHSQKPLIHSERHMRIICVGFGASGLRFTYKLQRSFKNFSLAVFEKVSRFIGPSYANT